MPGHIRTRIQCRTIRGLATAVLLTCISLVTHAQIRLDLPAQPLSQALTTLGSLANLNIYFDASTVDGIQAPALKSVLSSDVALARLLAGTKLRAVRVDESTFRVVAGTESKRAQGARDPIPIGAIPLSPPVHLASVTG